MKFISNKKLKDKLFRYLNVNKKLKETSAFVLEKSSLCKN